VKCPKCAYLGFETGDRCKNCGYDFSLMTEESASDEHLSMRPSTEAEGPAVTDLPLFTPAVDSDSDEPLIKLPATPRPPLAVRRTPDTPRLRSIPKPKPRVEPEPELDFTIEAPINGPRVRLAPEPSIAADRSAGVWAGIDHGSSPGPAPPRAQKQLADMEISPAGARVAAAAIDHVLLFGIDLAVLYFTLRMAGLTMADWSAVPALPFITFLLLVKLAYFCAFTAVGGQTIGKMAAQIRVVAVDDVPLEAAVAMKRTLAAAVSTVLLGAGFVPALVGSERRAMHDRLTRTRVIALPSA
jgi:uncharacterized RDD family membrane protein YckC